MSGLTDLDEILRTMSPRQVPGRFVFVTTDEPLAAAAMVVEDEGVSLVVAEQVADEQGLAHEGVFGWITLEVHSALDSAGLTAAVSAALAAQQISCNVIAGRHHDHLLVRSTGWLMPWQCCAAWRAEAEADPAGAAGLGRKQARVGQQVADPPGGILFRVGRVSGALGLRPIRRRLQRRAAARHLGPRRRSWAAPAPSRRRPNRRRRPWTQYLRVG